MRKKYKYDLNTRRFDLKAVIIAVMGVIIIGLLLMMLIPQMTASLRTEGFNQGVQLCQTQIMSKIVQDLNEQQFTAITIGEQTIKLGILDVKEVEPKTPE